MAVRNSVSMQDIADELGISKVTVSKALNGKDGVGEEMKEKIFQAAHKHGYVLPDYGRRKTKRVGIIMSDRFNSGNAGKFYMGMYEAILNELRESYCSGVMIAPSRQSFDRELDNIEAEDFFDGLILLGILDRKVRHRIEKMEIPKVYVDVYDEKHKSDSVVTENIYSTYEIAEYLLEKGHKNIGFVGTVGATTSITDRYLGFLRALVEQGLELKTEWMVSDRDESGSAVEISLPEELPTAFVCNCDESAFRLVKALKSRGLRVPDDVSVVGFDNDIYAELCEPQLTTVAVDVEEIGKVAAGRMVELMEKPQSRLETSGEVYRVPGKVIFRNSVKELK